MSYSLVISGQGTLVIKSTADTPFAGELIGAFGTRSPSISADWAR
jgi:hypothetical protein